MEKQHLFKHYNFGGFRGLQGIISLLLTSIFIKHKGNKMLVPFQFFTACKLGHSIC